MEKLYIFLYNAKTHHRAPKLSVIFNAKFSLENIINTYRVVLDEREQEYADIISGNVIMFDGERYVHPSGFSIDKVMKRKVNRCLEKMPSLVSRVEDKCPIHSKPSVDSEPQTTELLSTAVPLEDEGVEEEIAIDPSKERALVRVDLSLVPCDTI